MIPTCPKCGRWEFIPAPPGATADMPYPGPTYRSFSGPCVECLDRDRREESERRWRDAFAELERKIKEGLSHGMARRQGR